MKKIFLIGLVSIYGTTLQTKAQLRDTTSNINRSDASSLLQKSKNQKTTAWILLGGGAALVTTGFIIGSSSESFSDNSLEAGAVLVIAGGAGMLGSIPFFIASGKNKRKANVMIKNETVFFNPHSKIKEHLFLLE